MTLLLTLSALCVLLGIVLGAVNSSVLNSAVRTFALVAMAAVVLTHLLPESISSLGLVALLLFALGLVLPGMLEAGLQRSSGKRHGSFTMATWGLLLHSFGDGLAMEMVAGHGEAAHAHDDVIWALSLHKLPIAAFLVLQWKKRGHVGLGVAYAAGLWLATALGAVASLVLDPHWLHAVMPVILSLLSGLLFHALLHPDAEHGPRTTAIKLGDVLAAASGVAIVLFASNEAHHDEFAGGLSNVAALAKMTAGPLVFGSVVSVALARMRKPERAEDHSWWRGLFQPLTAQPGPCEVIPDALEQIAHGRDGREATAGLLASSAWSPEALCVSLVLLGVLPSGARWFGVLGVAALVAGLLGRKAKGVVGHHHHHHHHPSHSEAGGWIAALLDRFDHVAPWWILGITLAGLIEGQLGVVDMSGAVQIAIAVLFAILVFMPAVGVIPLVAVLMERGIAPAAAMALLILTPTLDWREISSILNAWGLRFSLGFIACLVAVALFFSSALSPILAYRAQLNWEGHLVGVGLALCVAVVSFWRKGLAGWLHGLGLDHDHPS